MNKHLFKQIIFFYLLIASSLSAYQGEEEVECVFSKISDIRHPTLQEYHLVENFLKFGERPYLSSLNLENYIPPLYDKAQGHRRMGRNLKLVGDNNEMPIFEIHHAGSKQNNERCILLYASYNYPYPEKARSLVFELIDMGYQGDILMRIGGFPNMDQEGLRLCHIPYAWKIAFFHEAKNLGYKQILWLDSSMHPLKDLEAVFAKIDCDGYLSLDSGVNLNYGYELGYNLKDAIEALHVSVESLNQIPHVNTWAVGFNLNFPLSHEILEEWLEETKKVAPCITWYPEELCFSIILWKHNCRPTMHCGNLVCNRENVYQISHFPTWNFFLDLNR